MKKRRRKSRKHKIKESIRWWQRRKGSRHRREWGECCASWSSLFMVTGTGGGWQQDLYREPVKKDGMEGWKWAKREVQKNGGHSQTKCQSPNGCQAFCFLPAQSCSTMWLISSTEYTAKKKIHYPFVFSRSYCECISISTTMN